MSSFFSLLRRVYTVFNPPVATKTPDALKCGVLGAANIAPICFVLPIRDHPEVILNAVAARDKTKAEKFAKKWGIEKTYSGVDGYQDLLNDPEISIVYIPLPNGLHYEWTLKALQAGKHVLLEKPFTDTAEEARLLFDVAEKKGLVLLEAFHFRFHPANLRVKEIIDGGELGKLKSLSVSLCTPNFLSDNDIRFNYELGGGGFMDMGSYTMNAARFFTGASPIDVISATPLKLLPKDERLEVGMAATLAFPEDVVAFIKCHMRLPAIGIIPRFPEISVVAECEGGSVSIFNYVVPSYYHYISVKPKKGKERTEKVYAAKDGPGKGLDYWSTYRHQLEAFVDKVKGREPSIWITPEDTIANMLWIEKVYQKSGLPLRPSPISK